MNNMKFTDKFRGNFGRKIIYSDVDSITAANVVKVLSNAMSTHWLNREQIKYLDDYYKGDQPILYRIKEVRPSINNKIVENHALETVRFMTAQNFGEPIQYVNRKKDENITDMVDKLNDYMSSIDKPFYDIQIGEWQSTVGTAYRNIYKDDAADCKFGIDVPDPKNTFIIYSSRTGKALMSVMQFTDSDGQNYYECFSKSDFFKIQNSKIISSVPNGFGGIPIVEYPNNSRRLSDIEIVITMFDALNNMQSNRMDGIEQFVQAFMKFVNCDIDKDEFLEMCQLGAIKIKGQAGIQADVDTISNELDQQQTQIAKEDLYKNIMAILGMPSREQNTGGDTGQAVYLRNGWDFAEQRAKIDEPVIIKAEKEFLRLALYVLDTKNTEVKLKISDIDVKITRNKTDNMVIKTQGLMNMLDKGIHPKIAIATCGLFGDPEKVYIQSKPYLDGKYQTIDEIKANQEKTPNITEKGGVKAIGT